MTETTTILGRPDAALPLAGTERVPMDQAGAVVTAGLFVLGQTYRIASIGSTNFIVIGAAANTVGLYFTATGVGAGNGTAATMTTVDASTQDIASLVVIGTAGSLDVAATGNASTTQVVKGNDTRLTDSRTPTSHTQTASTISDSTAAGRALLTAADAAAQRTSLGLGTAATTASTDYAPAAHVGSSGTAHAVATTTVAGFLSAADKTKLDAIVSSDNTILLKYVRNDTASSIAKGTPVYITGSSGTTLTIAPSDATDETRSARTIGVTQAAIGSNSNGYIVCVGLLDGISTTALTEGQLIWLSETTGQFTSTQPIQPANGVICGYCVKQGSGTSGILYIKIDNGYELDELHNVLISGAATDQALVRASDGLWKNRTVYSSATPAALGTAAAGTSTTMARGDHVHQLPSTTTLGAVSAVTGSAPIVSSGGLTPAISINAATNSAAGSMSSSDKTKLDAITGTNTGDQTITLTGEVTGSGTGSFAATVANSAVIGKVLTGYASSAGTVAATDTILGAIQKLNGNDAAKASTGAIGSSGLTMSTARLLGRSTAATGAVEEITVGTGLSLSGGTLTATSVKDQIGIACSDETTNLTTGTAKVTLRMPYAFTLTAVRLNCNTAPTGSALVVNVKLGGTTIFSTKPQIDAAAKTSVGSGTTAVISTSALTDDGEVTIDIDQIGSTIAGKGLKVWLIGTRA